jgi:hypothetical protein
LSTDFCELSIISKIFLNRFVDTPSKSDQKNSTAKHLGNTRVVTNETKKVVEQLFGKSQDLPEFHRFVSTSTNPNLSRYKTPQNS